MVDMDSYQFMPSVDRCKIIFTQNLSTTESMYTHIYLCIYTIHAELPAFYKSIVDYFRRLPDDRKMHLIISKNVMTLATQ